MTKICTDIDKTIADFSRDVNYGVCFDVLRRIFVTRGRKCALFMIDGTANQEVLALILSHLLSPADTEGLTLDRASSVEDFFMPYAELKPTNDYDSALDTALGGAPVLFVDGLATAFHVDAKHFPQRNTEEPEKDKVIRGSHDGFVEITIFNAALIRRRIRSKELMLESVTLATTAPCDVIVCYMRGRAKSSTVDNVKKRLASFDAEALTMNQETLSERAFKQKWYNPYPLVRYSERPDLVSASLLEGGIAIICDNSPTVMIVPAKFVDFFIEANDYYFPPFTGTYYRLIRIFMVLVGVFFIPAVVLITQGGAALPDWLGFLRVEGEAKLPLLAQIIVFELVIEAVRLSTMNMPAAFSSAMGVIGSVFIGEFTVQAGWAAPEIVFYMSFISLALYSQQNLEFGYAMKFFRIALETLSFFFGLWGFIGATAVILALTVFTRTIDGGWYFSPIIPFRPKELFGLIPRTRLRR